MQRNKITVLAALILGIVLLFGQPAFTTRAKAGTANTAKAAKVAKAGKRARIGNALGLSEEQKAKIKAIRSDAKQQAAAVKADASLTVDAKKIKIKAIRKSSIEQIRQLLTPEQQSKLRKGVRANKGKRAWRIARALGLTAEQKTEIKSIRQNAKAQIKALRADPSMTADAKKAKVKEIRAATKARVLEILTPEQRAKIEAARGRQHRAKQP